jgi:hypothetical protein
MGRRWWPAQRIGGDLPRSADRIESKALFSL